jgi:hypothetical protein
MSEISELMASNDPMATSVMSVGPAPPVNTTPSISEATAQIHEKQVEAFTTNNPLSAGNVSKDTVTKRKLHKLNSEQREAFVVACCAFIVLLPNIQQMILQQLPVLGTNSTLLTLVNAALVGVAYFGLKEHILDVL